MDATAERLWEKATDGQVAAAAARLSDFQEPSRRAIQSQVARRGWKSLGSASLEERPSFGASERQLVDEFRRRQRISRSMVVLFFLVWAAVGWVSDWARDRDARSVHAEVAQVLATGRAFKLRVDKDVREVDASAYAAIVAGEDDAALRRWDRLLLGSLNDPNHFINAESAMAADKDEMPTWIMPVILFMLVPLVPAIRWRHPARIVLLRPFGAGKVARSLRRLVRRNLSSWGHSFTLSDQYLNDNWLASQLRVWEMFSPSLLLGVVALFCWPLTRQVRPNFRIRKEKGVRSLESALQNRWNLNFFGAYSFLDRIRKIRATDAIWPRVIDSLLISGNVLVVDVTEAKQWVLWELKRIAALDLHNRVVLVALEDGVDENVDLPEGWPEAATHVHKYRWTGSFIDEPAGIGAIARILAGQPRPFSV